MRLPLYQVDAFTDRVFGGNPAAVCPLDTWLPAATMQAIATENNLSETAFVVPDGDTFAIRWFTPMAEIDLAGHPTLATAHVLFTKLYPTLDRIVFTTEIGDTLTVVKENDGGTRRYGMDFPARPPGPRDLGGDVAAALGAEPTEVLAQRDGFAVFETEAQVRAIRPDFAAVAALDCPGMVVTAPGDDCDFVSRFFAPAHGIPEDPVTGSAHTELIPYWANRLGKTEMLARQISQRGGTLWCSARGDRVGIAGQCADYLTGTIEFPDPS
jgi:PhzF family phenazine biosynthesis protein